MISGRAAVPAAWPHCGGLLPCFSSHRMYEVKSGTTIWERWDALRSDGTVNET